MKNIFDRLKEGIDSVVEGLATPEESETTENSTAENPMSESQTLPPSTSETDQSTDSPLTSDEASESADDVTNEENGSSVTNELCTAIDLIADKVKQFVTRSVDETEEPEPAEESVPVENEVGISSEVMSQIGTGQDELKRLFETRIRSDEVQAKAFERMHDEMQGYKQNFIRQEVMPLLKDVIYCYDLVARETERIQIEEQDQASGTAFKTMEVVEQMLLDILFKYDVEPFRGESEQFDPKTQQCVRTEPTEVEAEDKKIAVAGLSGFRSGDTIVRREQVTVFKYKSPEGS